MTDVIRIDRSIGEFAYSPHTPPRARVKAGTRLWCETRDPRSGALYVGEPGTFQPYPPPPGGKSNALTGPIFIEGATVGDVLAIHVTDIQLDSFGWMAARDTGWVLLQGSLDHAARSFLAPVREGRVSFKAGFQFPVRPMIGCIGVADPSEPHSGLMGAFGGNLDHATLTTGCTFYLPVLVDGALLYVGDVHAAMGDGELTGCALEIGAQVGLTVELIPHPQQPLVAPRYETSDHVVTVGWSTDFATARQMAVADMLQLLKICCQLSGVEAMMLISVAADLRIGQACGNMPLTLRLEMPKITGLTALPR